MVRATSAFCVRGLSSCPVERLYRGRALASARKSLGGNAMGGGRTWRSCRIVDRACERGDREGLAQHMMAAKLGLAPGLSGITGDEEHRDMAVSSGHLGDHL